MAKQIVKIPLESAPVSIIGPQLGLTNKPNEMVITVGLPDHNFDTIICVLKNSDGQECDRKESSIIDPIFRHYRFIFQNLKQDERYFYHFKTVSGKKIDLEGDLTQQDCYFYAPHFNQQTDKFVMLSCHNPFSSGHQDTMRQFRMWQRLDERIANDKNIRLIIQGGDQIYHDRLEKWSLKHLRKHACDETSCAKIRAEIIKNYQHYYHNLSFRRVLARIPSVAMLDDHDITDGWGGREESFNKQGTFRQEWQKFFDIAYEAYQAYQTCKNPAPIYPNATTTSVDLGDSRIFLLDYRAEKNFSKGQLLSHAHEKAISNAISETKKDIFVVVPVVCVRIDPAMEEKMGFVLRKVLHINLWLQKKFFKQQEKGKTPKIIELILKVTGSISSFSDDIYDALTVGHNLPYFSRLIDALDKNHQKNNNNIVILSGDIHTGGISEIFVADSGLTIPQIVSSPIAYAPMPKLSKI